MAHHAQREWVLYVKRMFPSFFQNCRVLDIGSLDINGSNREHFVDCEYVGLDLGPGKNVDVISPAHEYVSTRRFDTVISTEAFEHDQHLPATLQSILDTHLAPTGLLVFTCATTGRQEHGTSKTSPSDAPFTNEYYCNVTEQIIRDNLDMSAFTLVKFDVFGYDLRFFGIRR